MWLISHTVQLLFARVRIGYGSRYEHARYNKPARPSMLGFLLLYASAINEVRRTTQISGRFLLFAVCIAALKP